MSISIYRFSCSSSLIWDWIDIVLFPWNAGTEKEEKFNKSFKFGKTSPGLLKFTKPEVPEADKTEEKKEDEKSKTKPTVSFGLSQKSGMHCSLLNIHLSIQTNRQQQVVWWYYGLKVSWKASSLPLNWASILPVLSGWFSIKYFAEPEAN